MREALKFCGVLFVAGLAACGGGSQANLVCQVPDAPVLDAAEDAGDGEGGPAVDPGVEADAVVEADVLPGDTRVDGGFGEPCLSNKDCLSQYCIEAPEGYLCTQLCSEDCPTGWLCRSQLVGGDVVSLCVPVGASLCKPCQLDTQCGDGLCMDSPEGKACGRDCSGSACPNGYQCKDVSAGIDRGTTKQCLPVSGVCTCTVLTDGAERGCKVKNGVGTCLGIETCDKTKGWFGCSARTPVVEACNGIDDDCNGVADDNPTQPVDDQGKAIDCKVEVPGVGACPCQWVCDGPGGWHKAGATPKDETCNYIDDNCNGQTDEPFKDAQGLYSDVHNCGGCGNDCDKAIPFAKTVECLVTDGNPACVVVECLPGFIKSGANICLAQISNLCAPCVDDSNCGTGAGKCLAVGSGKFCGRDCSAASPFGTACPIAYVCNDFGAGVQQCAPASGSCDCTTANDGMHRVCANQNTAGTCYGTEACDPGVGWANCTARTPMHEICNGLDDDCNGFIDDGLDQPPAACSKSWSDPANGKLYSCAAPWACVEGGGGVTWVCDAKQPGPETCNGLDDNCDGQVDETFKDANGNYVALENCGACGVSCVGLVPHAAMKCDVTAGTARCAVDQCEPGYFKASDLSCQEFPGTQCQACASDKACLVPGDACLPADALGKSYCLWDCAPGSQHPVVNGKICPDGYVCQALDSQGQPLNRCLPLSGACDCTPDDEGEVRLCQVTNAAGTCTGQATCHGDTGWSACSAGTPLAETCNGLDDNCNGLIDEDFPQLKATCFSGLGVCQRPGVMVCNAAGDGVACSAVPGQGSPEVCNGLDDDCNGLTDENWPEKGKGCLGGVGGCQRAGTMVCSADGTGLTCDAAMGQPIEELCNGADDNCDGQTDETWPMKGSVCTVGNGQCARAGIIVCDSSGTGVTCDAKPGTSVVETCDYLDNDCDGLTDNGFVDASGKYVADRGCGNCFTDCTAIYALPNAYGTCDATGVAPRCRLNCGAGFLDLNGVPDDGCEFYLDPAVIYVSGNDAAAVDDASCGLGPVGTQAGAHPCRTVGYGLARAANTTGKTRVLVAQGLYAEAVTLTSGISLMGGYNPFTWSRDAAANVTVIRGQDFTPAAPGALNAIGITGTPGSTVVDGFTILGRNNPATGASSYAVYLRNSTGALALSNNFIEGGVGGAGAKGADGTNGVDGVSGNAGAGSYGQATTNCSAINPAVPRAGAAGGARTCGTATVVTGGTGGGNTCPPVYNAAPVAFENGGVGHGAAPGAGGAGGYDSQAWYCNLPPDGECHQPTNGTEVGHPGTKGGAGSNGATSGSNGCSVPGNVADGLWLVSLAANGADGTSGSGGGGGGAGGGAQNDGSCGARTQLGGTGGGGGSGGCGGSGGKGGGAGGGSFALFAAWDSVPATVPTLAGNTIRGGQGGAGGYGGNGGSGLREGAGAPGGRTSTRPTRPSARHPAGRAAMAGTAATAKAAAADAVASPTGSSLPGTAGLPWASGRLPTP